ncbi:MAG: ethanolamine ammonia-lyase subunit EutC [Spirochaetales bacterium]|nr:ethanolamine ammonia-lyase subunit EutC [Spirochaetales bacterium]
MSIIGNPWTGLKQYTDARIALGRTGASLPTAEHLDFQMSHALARDAVHQLPDYEALKKGAEEIFQMPCPLLDSRAADRTVYLQRPDLGRRLSRESAAALKADGEGKEYDFSLTIGDGLSARALEGNLIPFLKALVPELTAAGLKSAPPVMVRQCRVACGDEVAALQSSKISVVLIGERPGLSSPDSLGVYLTWAPEPGETGDDKRNCISNIRGRGMTPEEGSRKLVWLLKESLTRKISGVALKDEQQSLEGNTIMGELD